MEIESAKKNVVDVLENAQNYAVKLHGSLSSLKDAQTQIQHNANMTRSNIEETFSNLKAMLLAAVDHRKEQLIAEVCSIQEEALNPLQECYYIISDKLKLTSELVDEGQNILLTQKFAEVSLKDFNYKSVSLGSLPEVPDPSQVPSISFTSDPTLASEICATISSHGTISQTSPVQITQSFVRPGAVFLHWEEIEADREASEFRLQYLKGDARKMDRTLLKFCDIYCGSETSFLIKDLKPHVLYSFRVSSRLDGTSLWSAWSIPYVTCTSLPPYEWDAQNENYSLSHKQKVANKVTTTPSVLYSAAPQYRSGHSLLFKILECDASSADEGLGLARSCKPGQDTILSPGFFFVNAKGVIFMDGIEMTTHLPPLTKGSTVIFESEGLANKVRVNIECQGKTVIYDWKMDKDRKDANVYFIAFFRKKGWKILVE